MSHREKRKVSEPGFIGLPDYQDFPIAGQIVMMPQTSAGDDEKMKDGRAEG